MDFLIATHNRKKQFELQRVLKPLGINVLTADDIGVELTEVDETGKTFEENARLKAVSGLRETSLPCIADDSGLCVDALGGAPGIYSARFSGDECDDRKNNEKLLKELENVDDENRTAKFVCCIVCAFPDGSEICVQGECKGKIAHELHGEGGFGYDPLFMTKYGCFGEMTSEEKDAVSHRGNAIRLFVIELEKKNITK